MMADRSWVVRFRLGSFTGGGSQVAVGGWSSGAISIRAIPVVHDAKAHSFRRRRGRVWGVTPTIESETIPGCL